MIKRYNPPMSITKQCNECSQTFELVEKDLEVLKKFDAPCPKLCPDCRMQRRMAFRNEMNFHKALCEITGKTVLTNIAPNQGYKVICLEKWYSDEWDPMEYGRDFDFSRPFFEQMKELIKDVPHINLMQSNSENCEYCSFPVNSKDCYLCSRLGHAEKCYYSYLVLESFNCFDCYYVKKCQECYEAIDCFGCYRCFYSQRLENCSDVLFSFDCTGCENCFGCYGLRRKKYHFFDKPMGKNEYEAALKNVKLGSHQFVEEMRLRFYNEVVLAHPIRHAVIVNGENVIGDYVHDSRNVFYSFDVNDSEDVHYSVGVQSCKDMYDVYTAYHAEECYNTVGVAGSQRVNHTFMAYPGCFEIEYCMEVANNVRNCFGCIGLKQKEFCILNKQYTEVEYYALKARIIEHMRKPLQTQAPRQGGVEYGEFFPMDLSTAAYNESVAGEYFPLTRQEVERRGLFWHEEYRDPLAVQYELPDNVADTPDDVCAKALASESSGKPYKVIQQELKFLSENSLPLPRFTPYERHLKRLTARGVRKLFERRCSKCQAEVHSTYAPNRPEQIYCEKCYLKEMY